MGEGGRGGVPDNRAIFKVRADKSNIKLDDGRGGRVNIEVSKEESKELTSFAADGGNVSRPGERGC